MGDTIRLSRPVTLRQCAILVGGLGTRLGALTATTPKPLLDVGGRPFLAWLMREFVRFGVEEFVLLTGHLSDELRAAIPAIAASLPRAVRIEVSEEPVRAGTGGALVHAAARLDERFWLCNGDSLLDFNLARMLAAAAQDEPGVCAHMLLRRVDDASRYGVVELQGERVTAFRERPAAGQGGVINGGVYILDRSLIGELDPVCSLEADVLPRLAREGRVRGVLGDGYFIDIGVPEDLQRARRELPARLRRPALFLDRDGVINRDHGWVGERERFEWMPGAGEAVRMANDLGVHVFVVTNQAGVAKGRYDEGAVNALHGWMVDALRQAGASIDDIRYCPYHEEGSVEAYRRRSDWRKPEPGMILDLIRCWELDPGRCRLIGDKPSDLAAAEAAGLEGVLFEGEDLLEAAAPILKALIHA